MSKNENYAFLLVHGGWCSGEVYSDVSDLLRSRGHKVVVPDLTGLGARSHLLRDDIGVRTHIQDVVNTIRWADLSGIVLVGHSYGGMVITGVAEEIPDKIDSIVYLDAFLPADGQALIDLAVIPEAIDLLKRAKATGATSIPFPSAFADGLGIPPDLLWKFTPHPTATFFEPVPSTNGLTKIRKKTFVRASQWPDHEEVFERLRNDSSWTTVAVSSGHMLQWEVPDRCVEILEEAAT